MNHVVFVDRLKKPGEAVFVRRKGTFQFEYPSWMIELAFPSLEISGPEQYRLGDLKELSIPKDLRRDGVEILKYLKLYHLISGCLSLRDLEEIAKLDRSILAECFGKKNLLGWKSVVLGRFGVQFVPCLMLKNRDVAFRWIPLTDSDIGERGVSTYRLPG